MVTDSARSLSKKVEEGGLRLAVHYFVCWQTDCLPVFPPILPLRENVVPVGNPIFHTIPYKNRIGCFVRIARQVHACLGCGEIVGENNRIPFGDNKIQKGGDVRVLRKAALGNLLWDRACEPVLANNSEIPGDERVGRVTVLIVVGHQDWLVKPSRL
jgi:hypothetical protein